MQSRAPGIYIHAAVASAGMWWEVRREAEIATGWKPYLCHRQGETSRWSQKAAASKVHLEVAQP